MPTKPVAGPKDAPHTLNVTPITSRRDTQKLGRPKKHPRPEIPDFGLEGYEQSVYDFTIQSLREENPDLTNFDLVLIPFIALEIVKYMRVAKDEITTGTVISMARQHPMTQLARLVDLLSVSRKQRNKSTQPKDDGEYDEFFKNLSS